MSFQAAADRLLGAHADGMLDPASLSSDKVPVTIRAVFIIGPDKKLKLSLNCERPSPLSCRALGTLGFLGFMV